MIGMDGHQYEEYSRRVDPHESSEISKCELNFKCCIKFPQVFVNHGNKFFGSQPCFENLKKEENTCYSKYFQIFEVWKMNFR